MTNTEMLRATNNEDLIKPKDYLCRDAAAVMVINQIKESLSLYQVLTSEQVVESLKGYLSSYDSTIEKLKEIEER